MNASEGAVAKAAVQPKGAKLVAVCSYCRRMRTSTGTWRKMTPKASAGLEPTEITHTICPQCIRTLYPELER